MNTNQQINKTLAKLFNVDSKNERRTFLALSTAIAVSLLAKIQSGFQQAPTVATANQDAGQAANTAASIESPVLIETAQQDGAPSAPKNDLKKALTNETPLETPMAELDGGNFFVALPDDSSLIAATPMSALTFSSLPFATALVSTFASGVVVASVEGENTFASNSVAESESSDYTEEISTENAAAVSDPVSESESEKANYETHQEENKTVYHEDQQQDFSQGKDETPQTSPNKSPSDPQSDLHLEAAVEARPHPVHPEKTLGPHFEHPADEAKHHEQEQNDLEYESDDSDEHIVIEINYNFSNGSQLTEINHEITVTKENHEIVVLEINHELEPHIPELETEGTTMVTVDKTPLSTDVNTETDVWGL